MKQIKILGVLAIALTLGLASCNKGADQSGGGDGAASEQQGGGSEEHVHTFEEGWTSNASKHWHKATCGHNVKDGEAAHTFGDPYDVVAPTCEKAGSQKVKCSVCGYEKTENLKALGHSAAPAEGSADWTPIGEPTCTAVGSHSYICSNCHEAVVVEMPALGHVYEQENGEDKVVWTKEANCTEAGEGTKTCTRCGVSEAVTKAALGHVYEQENGEDKVVWSRQANCTLGGIGTKTCTRCNAVADVKTEALGHDLKLVGNDEAPTDGTALVRLYQCQREGCGQTYMGFLANEPSEASKPHLVIGSDGGARFWGRPIGNDVPLNENGDPDRDNHPSIFNKEQTGDFFEYIFNLDADQAAVLETCRCYCVAKPADYLGSNGIDFWANKSGDEDWTRGRYIDDDPAHQETDSEGNVIGKEITDYRYVLYVDDVLVEFDKDTKVPVPNGDPKGEYVMPYTFHLHAGTNKISLRMAGGYRSTFYEFIFRPYVEPDPVIVNETSLEIREGKTAQITSSMEGLTYKSSSNSICTVDKDGVVTGVKAGEATITVSKEGNYKDATVPVTVLEKEGVISLNLTDGVIAPAENGLTVYNSSSSGTWYREWKKDTTLTYTFQSTLAGKFDIQLGLRGSNIALADNFNIKVNGADVTLAGTVNTSYSAVDTIVGKADLQVGENTMVITALADCDLYLKTLKLIPAEEGGEGGEGGDAVDYTQVLVRTWDANPTAKTNSSDKEYFQLNDSTNNKAGVKISMMNFTLDATGTEATGITSGKIDPGNNHNAILTYRITAPKAGAYQMIMRAKSSTSNNALTKSLNDRYFTVKLNGVAVDIQGDRVPLTAETADFVAAPTINLTGNEDVIEITAPDYRPVFDVSAETGFIVFAEH